MAESSETPPAMHAVLVERRRQQQQQQPQQPPPPPQPHPQPARKLKGRQRLLQGFQRVSSVTSLGRMGMTSPFSSSSPPSSTSSPAYDGTGRGSMSCVSLGSPASFRYGHSCNASYDSQSSTLSSSSSSAAFSTAPTSLAGSPGGGGMGWSEPKTRIRLLGRPSARCATNNAPMTAPLPSDVYLGAAKGALATPQTVEVLDDYFSLPAVASAAAPSRRQNFDFWAEMPDEIKVEIFRFLAPKELVRCSAVSRRWRGICFDGQLWTSLDASEFYREIPRRALVRIMAAAGPFVRDLNLRGCVQLRERWVDDGESITDVCRNLRSLSLEGSRIDGRSMHHFLWRLPRLVHVNLAGLDAVTNWAVTIIAENCPLLEHLDVSWCQHVDTCGLRHVVRACPRLRDLRAGKVKGFGDRDFLVDLFERNTLERLLLSHCADFGDDSLLALLQGASPEVDVLTGRALAPPRAFLHLDFSGCRQLTDRSVGALAHRVPLLRGLRLSQCASVTDAALVPLLPTVPELSHLDVEELGSVTNALLAALSGAACAPRLRHLSISHCDSLSDAGVVPLLRAAPSLRNLEMDNTRVSDLALHEAAAQVRARNGAAEAGNPDDRPRCGLRIVAYDCPNVTWTGVRAVLAHNAAFFRRAQGSTQPCYPKEVVGLKCFHGFQPTVDEHTKRVLAGELARATMLERKWADWMLSTEEAGIGGVGARRRRRRAREAARLAGREGTATADGADGAVPGRRRARSSGCTIM